MRLKQLLPALFLMLVSGIITAQDTIPVAPVPELIIEQQPEVVEDQPLDYKPYNPLAPAKAAFYSAILPGLGQAYNGKYWKIPLAYAGIGAGVYFYIQNDRQYDRYRSIYKSRLAGNLDDEFVAPNGVLRVTNDGLIRAQRLYSQNKEISVLVIVGFYALNIIDANVDAHLQQFNVSEDLSVKPSINIDNFTGRTGYVLSLNYNF